MPRRVYLVPAEIVDRNGGTERGPLYFEWGLSEQAPRLPLSVLATWIDYGHEDAFLVSADTTPGQHTQLVAQPNVVAVPLDLDATIANVANLRSALEAFNIPANWVEVTDTYREVLRGVAVIFFISQRFVGQGRDRLVAEGVTMNTAASAMPAAYRQALLDAIDSLGYDRTGLTNASTLRDLLETIQAQRVPLRLKGTTI